MLWPHRINGHGIGRLCNDPADSTGVLPCCDLMQLSGMV